MEDQSLISYTANIGGRQYPLKIKSSEKKIIDQTIADINDRVAKMKASYASKDVQDWVAMAFLSLAYDLNKSKAQSPVENTSLISDLETIESKLDTLLD